MFSVMARRIQLRPVTSRFCLCNSLPGNCLHRETRNQVVTFAVQFHFTRFLLLATVFCGPAEGPLGSRMRKLHFESHVSDRCETRYLGPHDVPNRSQQRSGTFSSRR